MLRMPEFDPVRIPKNNGRALLTLVAALMVFAAVVLMFVGFVDAGTVAPEETEGSAPPVDAPATLPR